MCMYLLFPYEKQWGAAQCRAELCGQCDCSQLQWDAPTPLPPYSPDVLCLHMGAAHRANVQWSLSWWERKEGIVPGSHSVLGICI